RLSQAARQLISRRRSARLNAVCIAPSLHLVLVEVIDTAAGAFRVIERQISTLQQLLRIASILRRDGYADRRPDGNSMTVNVVWRADLLDKALRQPRSLQVRLLRDLQDHELVASHPGHRIGSTHAAPEPFSNGT